VEDFPEHH